VRLGTCVIFCLLVTAVISQAAGAAVYQVPAEISGASCAEPVEDEIMAWLATVPDGNTARFAPGGCYGHDGTITLTGRSGLVIDGQGAEFRALTLGGTHRANWRFVGGTNLTVQNLAVRGSNPAGGYTAGFEWQHGFSVEGVQGMTLTNVQARETWGDGVYLDHSTPSPACGDDASSTRNVSITGATLERIGRQGVAVVDAENVTVRDSAIGPVALANVDLETDDDCALARHIAITRNQFGAHTWGVVDSVGFGAHPQVGDVTVTDNTESAAAPGCFAPIRILSPVVPAGQPPVYRQDYTFTGNRLRGTRNGFEFRGLHNVDVSSNSVALPPTTGCGKRAGVLLVDSHNVAITSNAFLGANSFFKADTLSTGITAEGNWTVETAIGSAPSGTVNSASASFGFSSDPVGASFECKLDGGTFDPCASPKEYTGLSDGPHAFDVRAVDAAGNRDPTPASRSWTVDTASANTSPPETGTTSGPSPLTEVTSPVTALLVPLIDVTPPVVELGGKRTQIARRTVRVTVKPTSENVWATALGRVAIRGSTRAYRLKGISARAVLSGYAATLKLEMSRKALTAARRALYRGRRVRAELKIALRDAAGNVATGTRTIKLAR
jgi:hypothetical protein